MGERSADLAWPWEQLHVVVIGPVTSAGEHCTSANELGRGEGSKLAYVGQRSAPCEWSIADGHYA